MKTDDLGFTHYEDGDEEEVFQQIEALLYWTLPELSFEKASQRVREQGATTEQIEYALEKLTNPSYIPHRMVLV